MRRPFLTHHNTTVVDFKQVLPTSRIMGFRRCAEMEAGWKLREGGVDCVKRMRVSACVGRLGTARLLVWEVPGTLGSNGSESCVNEMAYRNFEQGSVSIGCWVRSGGGASWIGPERHSPWHPPWSRGFKVRLYPRTRSVSQIALRAPNGWAC